MIEVDAQVATHSASGVRGFETQSTRFRFSDYESQCEPARLHAESLNVLNQLTTSKVRECTHHFTPQGFSLILSVPEIFLAIHTWPELGLLTVDVVSQNPELSLKVVTQLQEALAWVAI
ncbi:MAG: S-adenosylmethionine decarboxylase [Myxococcota bacterium]|nr:S-adenosylmethionine decarboxylase [Myxococcota bacterium]